MKLQYQVRLDYVTANFSNEFDLGDVSRYLAGDPSVFCWHQCGDYETAASVSPLGLYYLPNSGWNNMRCLRFSGVGCEKFAYSLLDFANLVHPTFSRLDFAIDVCMKKSEWKSFIGSAFVDSLSSDRKRKCYSLAGSGEAMTVYIGSRRGSKFCRIYNKTLEDPSYVMEDEHGNRVNVSDDDYVIRYELELKRFTRSYSDKGKVVYDPSDLFYLYFSEDPHDQQQLIDLLIGYWKSYCTEALYPSAWLDFGFFLRSERKRVILFSSHVGEDPCQATYQELHEYPHTFEHTLQFLVDRFAKYIPYLVSDPVYLDQCLRACKLNFGFAPDISVDHVNHFSDSDPLQFSDLDDPCDDLPPEFIDVPIDGFI